VRAALRHCIRALPLTHPCAHGPQGPTGMRSVIELIEELVLRGGGTGLFTGCAAGDSAMALALRVSDQRRK